MKRKRKALLAAFAAFGISASVAYAWTIPGVDEPFDPPDYYSPTSISYPDSAPSPFALKEISRGNVYDYTRHIKSILFGNDFSSIKGSLLSQLLNQVINMTSMDGNTIAQTQQNLNNAFSNTQSIGIGNDVAGATQQSLFRTTDTAGNPNYSYDPHAQFSWASNIYHTSLQALSDSDSDMKNRMDALNTVLDNSAESNGNIASSQAEAQVSALYNTETTRRNTLLANNAAVEAAHDRMKLSQDMESIEAAKNGLAFPVFNSDKATVQDNSNYTRPSAPGFYDF